MTPEEPVLFSLKEMVRECGESKDSYFYMYDGEKIKASQMITELENDTEIGKKFRDEVYKTIISYLMKFKP